MFVRAHAQRSKGYTNAADSNDYVAHIPFHFLIKYVGMAIIFL